MVSRVSARDLENDGYETAIDTCPAVANVENPRSTAGPDGDMLDSACDPTPAVAAHDADNDGIQNAGDNCPLATNASQVEGELTFPPDYFTHAFDGGPTADRLGDACESGSVVFTQNNKSTTINLSPTVANGHWHLRGEVHPRCYSTAPVDADGDGYCSTGTAGCAGSCLTDSTATDSGACAGTVPPSCVQRHSAWGSGVLAPQGLFDTDRGGGDSTGSTPPDLGGIGEGITCPGGASDVCPQGAFDSDWIETYVGTNPAQSCAADATLNNEPYDSWIYDLNDDQRANLSDLSMYTGPYSRFVNQPGSSVRYDFNVDGVTNLADVSILGGAPFNKQCRRTDGTFGEPQ